MPPLKGVARTGTQRRGSQAVIVDGYVRVSPVRGRSGDRFISSALQREQIERWASGHGACLDRVHEELDASGASADRPKLLEAVARVEGGQVGGLVVATLDRFGRSHVDGVRYIERIRAAGGTFVSVADGFDLSTDTGRLMLRFMLSMAEWKLDRVRSGWDAARERDIARGVQLGPVPPTGYVRDVRGHLRPNPVSAPAITDLFRQRAAGASIAELARHLEAHGVRSPYGGSGWARSSITDILRNRTYLGEVRSGQFVNAAVAARCRTGEKKWGVKLARPQVENQKARV